MVEYTCDFLRLQATHNIKEFEEQTFARSNVCPNMMLNACVGEYHEGDTRIDFGEDLEHINEFAQVEGEVVNLMVQLRNIKVGNFKGQEFGNDEIDKIMSFWYGEDENAIRLLLKEQSDAFTSRLIAIQTELEATKGLVQRRHEGGGDQGSAIPPAMRLDIPKFNGVDPDSWVFSINDESSNSMTSHRA
ncbi:hypothetical protein Tco_1578486 [Tanacetum coccineum]